MIRRVLLAALIAGCAAAAPAQDAVLVSRMPQYQHGESFTGVMFSPNGERLELRQQIERKPGGRTYLYARMISSDGLEVLSSVTDVDTFLSYSSSEQDEVYVLSNTCSSATLYPIVLGKAYECKLEAEVNGEKTQGSKSAKFTEVRRNRQGALVEFCGRSEEQHADMQIDAKLCMSADGKWVTESAVLGVYPKILSRR